MWGPADADVASTSWDVTSSTLDFGSGAPVWLQRTIPTFIQNHLIVIPDMMPDEPGQSTSGGSTFLGGAGAGGDAASQGSGSTGGLASAGSVSRSVTGSNSGSMDAGVMSSTEERVKGRGLWVCLGLSPPDMEAFVAQGVEVIRT